MKASVVIGTNFGDEGKGLITDYLAALEQSDTLVIRFNGGAQAGHTVQRPNGLRHVFSHFGSGTFANASTYLSNFFIANPILFKKELEKLWGYGFSPQVIIHPHAIITTPYDMYLNQLIENFRGDQRHGSCGVGINETIVRNQQKEFQLTVIDAYDQPKLKDRLLHIRDHWLESRLQQMLNRTLSDDEKDLIFSNEIFMHFLGDIEFFLNHCKIATTSYIKTWSNLIFEGAQGLLLDQNSKYFPHVTHSNTGLQNVSAIAHQCNINHLDIHYVSRCYLTRHGAGPLPNETATCPCPNFKDETNLPHRFQGSLRFAPLDIAEMRSEINRDLNKLSNHITRTINLAITCLDQFDDRIPIVNENGIITELNKANYLDFLIEQTNFDNYIFSYGPTREDCNSDSFSLTGSTLILN